MNLDRPAAELAAELNKALRAAGFGPSLAELCDQQVLCLAEEVGEAVGEYRRMTGRARRTGALESLEAELADVVITAHSVASLLGVDLDKAITEKFKIIFSRGWKEEHS